MRAAPPSTRGPKRFFRYEVRRERLPGKYGVPAAPHVEEFLSLDRARLAALGYGLDGESGTTGERFMGVVRIFEVHYARCGAGGGQVERVQEVEVDAIDERVAWYVTNWMTIPRPEQLAVSLGDLGGDNAFGDEE
jgi:hypothetical protein